MPPTQVGMPPTHAGDLALAMQQAGGPASEVQRGPTSPPTARRLACAVQSYDWGARDAECLVGRFAPSPSPESETERATECCSGGGNKKEKTKKTETTTFHAEAWMGCHPNGPSRLADGPDAGTTLLSHLGGRPLPFLFKFLSVRKALSIQVHPDAAQAARLHAADPEAYRDPHAKAEMAIAISPVSLLCGSSADWRRVAREEFPEASRAILLEDEEQSAGSSDGAAPLRAAIAGLLAWDAGAAEAARRAACARLQQSPRRSDRRRRRLFLRLAEEHPEDPQGAFVAALMNEVRLAPGEAIAISPGTPHAYLRGDLAECMRCSDNVVRAGLTTKRKDVPALLACASFAAGPPPPKIVPPAADGDARLRTYAYDGEFSVAHVPAFTGEHVVPEREAIVAALRTDGPQVAAFYAPANACVTLPPDVCASGRTSLWIATASASSDP